MGRISAIEWTHSTYNAWRGCTKISPGCQLCYADRQARRNPKVLGVWGPHGTRVLASRSMWDEPEKWNTDPLWKGRRLVFCASLADVFEDWPGQMTNSKGEWLWWHPRTPYDYPKAAHQRPPGGGEDWQPYTLPKARERLWKVIRDTPKLTWQILTKRPENIKLLMPPGDWKNVWLGVSVESQDYLWRVDALTEARERINCPVGFISYEPALGPLEMLPVLPGVQWVIVGGESGGQARPMNLEWARSAVLQCKLRDVPVFMKQLGKNPTPGRYNLRLRSDPSHNGDIQEFPDEIAVREMPA